MQTVPVPVAVLPRLIAASLEAHLGVMPAVVVTGARQTGKSTLVRELLPGTWRYFSLDDLDTRDMARRDPEALVAHREPVILDEIQREPRLLHAVKQAIDERRQRGRFLLTGSASLLLMQRVSESLAGRASCLALRPMTRREQLGLGTGGIWDELLATPDEHWPDLVQTRAGEPADWRQLALRGGFPIRRRNPDRLLPIEVKATTSPRLGDARHLCTFLAEYAEQCRTGLLLHGGDTTEWLTPDVLAVPWWRVM